MGVRPGSLKLGKVWFHAYVPAAIKEIQVNEMGKSKIAWFASVAVAGGIGIGIAVGTDLPPVPTGLLAGLTAALLGTILFVVLLRVVRD
jgi:hypothetical protein